MFSDNFSIHGEVSDHLIEQALGVAHTSFGGTGDGVYRVVVKVDIFGTGDKRKTLGNEFGRNRQQIKSLAARNDSREHLVDFGSCKDEFDVSRRLFNCLEQYIPCRFTEHVDFVYDIYFVAAGRRTGKDIFCQFSHVSGGVSACCVNFNNVKTAFFNDRPAAFTFAAGFSVAVVEAVHRFGENASECGLSDSARTHEEIGMGGTFTVNSIEQSPNYVLLTYDIGKASRTPFSGYDLIFTHDQNCSRMALCISNICLRPCSARSSSSLSVARENGLSSAVPWTSMSFPLEVITTFISTSAAESSS